MVKTADLPLETLPVLVVFSCVPDIIHKYYHANVSIFQHQASYTLHRLSKKESVQTDFQVMHDCYFVAPLQPTASTSLTPTRPSMHQKRRHINKSRRAVLFARPSSSYFKLYKNIITITPVTSLASLFILPIAVFVLPMSTSATPTRCTLSSPPSTASVSLTLCTPCTATATHHPSGTNNVVLQLVHTVSTPKRRRFRIN